MNAIDVKRLDVTAFGAKGDGVTDDTAAFRAALAEASKISGSVMVPEGVYSCGELHLPPHTGLVGTPSWAYRSVGGSIITLNDAKAACLINLTGAVGATLNGLALSGNDLGEGIHGVYMGPVDKVEEDAPHIERCHISHFTGDGICLDPVWCFSVRGCEVIFNKRNAITVRGWDGFILDNWLSGNGGAGYASDQENAAVTMTGNRIEWNANGGIRIAGGSQYNITGNYIDRSGGPGITLTPLKDSPCMCITITGNVIYRSGRPEWTHEPLDSAHVRFEGAHGVVCTGNSMCVGQDDGSGSNSPEYGMVMHNLENCIIKDNALHIGALTELIHDLGEHQDGVIIHDNVGSLYRDRGLAIWASKQR